jgi:drug/metabolite transporter (DMT)-like permease
VLFATALTLASAVLHATWNLLVKTSDERDLAAWGQFVAGALIFTPVLVVAGLPDGDAFPYLGASMLVHVVYVTALVAAYHHGDFSFAYPVARGLGAVIAAVGGFLILDDGLNAGEWAALAVAAAGLISFVRPGVTAPSIGFAALTGLTIGVYTLLDASGARRTDNGFAYAVALTIAVAVALSAVYTATGRGAAFVQSIPGSWPRYLGSGVALTAAYGLVLVAVRHAPVGYVATLRESSVLIGALMGWLLLGEQMGAHRIVSAIVVTAGLVGLVVLS